MAEQLRAQVIRDENSSKRKRTLLILLAIPFLCCCLSFLLAWFTGDALVEFLGLADLIQP